jgi:hypothetical protein
MATSEKRRVDAADSSLEFERRQAGPKVIRWAVLRHLLYRHHFDLSSKWKLRPLEQNLPRIERESRTKVWTHRCHMSARECPISSSVLF